MRIYIILSQNQAQHPAEVRTAGLQVAVSGGPFSCTQWCSQASLTEALSGGGGTKCQARDGCSINRAVVTVSRQSLPVSSLPVPSIPQTSHNAGLSDSLGIWLSSLSLSLTASQGLPRGCWNHFPNPGFFMVAITVNANT